MKFSTSILLAFVAILAVAFWIVMAMMPTSGTGRLVENIPLDSTCPLEQLPLAATDVAYHYGGGRNPNTFYEFKIDEDDFLKWVAPPFMVLKIAKTKPCHGREFVNQ